MAIHVVVVHVRDGRVDAWTRGRVDAYLRLIRSPPSSEVKKCRFAPGVKRACMPHVSNLLSRTTYLCKLQHVVTNVAGHEKDGLVVMNLATLTTRRTFSTRSIRPLPVGMRRDPLEVLFVVGVDVADCEQTHCDESV